MSETRLMETPKSHTPKQHRLTDTDKALALRYAKEGLTQTVIAQRLGVTQSAISLWLSKCHDTRAEAGQYLDGQSLHLAQRAVKKGTATDLIKLLQGRNVLGEGDSGPKVLIQIGGVSQDVTVGVMVSPVVSPCLGEGHENS
jgi:Homeodomain-like domain